MSVLIHESVRIIRPVDPSDEIRAGYRLKDLARLRESPLIPFVRKYAAELARGGRHVALGISTKESVADGSMPTVSILFDLRMRGEFGNSFNPQVWKFSRVDLVAEAIGDHPLRIDVQGALPRHTERMIPRKETDIEGIRESLDRAVKNPKYESEDMSPFNGGFYARGLEKLSEIYHGST